ncbi:MAG: acyl-CoA thioesterase [Flavobacteriales bacterium]|nr:acyl-CoA thioesterase [Flavobacteriales bacterium]
MKFEPKDFQANVDVQLRFRDLDMLGHVNNAVYLSWMELGRMAFSDALWPFIDWKKEGFILAHVSIDYLEPVYLTDKVKVYMRVGKVGTKSVHLECVITKDDGKGERPAAKGLNVIVGFDYVENRSMNLPEKWLSAVRG